MHTFLLCCCCLNEEISKSPYWFDWLSLVANIGCIILSIIAGFLIASSSYNTQKKDAAEDAYNGLRDSLDILKDSVKKTTELLTDFKGGLSNENDNFTNPSLPISLNGRFLDKVDLPALKRYYKLKGAGNYDNLMSFLNQSNILGVYYDMFMNELNYFRTRFQISEQIFQRHKLLSINLAMKWRQVNMNNTA